MHNGFTANKQSYSEFIKIICLIIVFAFMFLLMSCGGSSKYNDEEVIQKHSSDSPLTLELSSFLNAFFVNSLTPVDFDRFGKAKNELTECALIYLIGTDFPLYSANGELYENALKFYPEMDFYYLIPVKDCDRVLYEYFNAVNVRYADTANFVYLDKIKAYTANIQPSYIQNKIQVYQCDETENTYRLLARNTSEDGDIYGQKYEVLFIKKDEGFYIDSLKVYGEEK